MNRLHRMRGAAALGAAMLIYGCAPSETRPPAENSAQASVSTCALCHGADGISRNPIWPSLAGLDARYLRQQLDALAQGDAGPRRSPQAAQMYAVSASLDERQRDAIAAYYAQLAAPPWQPPSQSGPAHEIFAQGSGQITACISCHGAKGGGNADLNTPRIAGQTDRYIASQLKAYADGTRDDANSGMAMIARAMSDEQILSIADYLAPTAKEPK